MAAHPGEFIKSKIIDDLGTSVTDAAYALGVTRPSLSKLLNGRSQLSPEMALRIEKAFGIPMEILMRLQNDFDISEARNREHEIIVSPFTRRAAPVQLEAKRNGRVS